MVPNTDRTSRARKSREAWILRRLRFLGKSGVWEIVSAAAPLVTALVNPCIKETRSREPGAPLRIRSPLLLISAMFTVAFTPNLMTATNFKPPSSALESFPLEDTLKNRLIKEHPDNRSFHIGLNGRWRFVAVFCEHPVRIGDQHACMPMHRGVPISISAYLYLSIFGSGSGNKKAARILSAVLLV